MEKNYTLMNSCQMKLSLGLICCHRVQCVQKIYCQEMSNTLQISQMNKDER